MLLSIVTGTYNRYKYLRQMVESARHQIPRHIAYEFVVVDGGSNDLTLKWIGHEFVHVAEGTPTWLRSVPNLTLVQHGRLLGAIPAFCDGARAAKGDYVILANDDVVFHPGSILRAIAHLEDNRQCGMVAFADNRSQQMGHARGHRTEVMPAINAHGETVGVTYGQVAMVRRWLGDVCGWWGDKDPVMKKARTYGGDNYLSARIWEHGYTVDAVKGCAVDDLIPADNLRSGNGGRSARNDSRLYNMRYPKGPKIAEEPLVPNRQPERLRVIVADIHEPRLPARDAKEYGLSEAMSQQALTWQVDYVNDDTNLVDAVTTWQPHLLLTQAHGTDRINAGVLSRCKEAKPDLVVVNWNGDAHEKGLIKEDILEMLGYVDLQTVVNTAQPVRDTYEQRGVKWAYWQIGYKDPAAPYSGVAPKHDVLFMGNCYNDERHHLIEALDKAAGTGLGLYGSCPGATGNTHYDFAHQRALYEAATITVSDVFPNTEGFVSNRLFQALSAGAFVLQQHSPKLDEYTGLKAGVHYIEWRNLRELELLIAEWMKKPAKERNRIAKAGKTYVRKHFSYDAQVTKLWGLLEEIA